MILAIDAGNSRIKWGVWHDDAWQAQGALALAEAASLAELIEPWPAPSRIVICNVAGAAVDASLRLALGERLAQARWLRPGARQCGVVNRYQSPERLGADRWAALIGARARVTGACLVVCAGTATTVDLLDAEGVFQGGLILPGLDLMRRSLADATALLPFADGEFCEQPRRTEDAIVSGCLHAQAGAVERLYRQLPEGSPCLLSGGSAPALAARLALPVWRIDNLVLEGLLRFAAEDVAV
ncbi:type III pantothenate kinase [Rhodocyclus tenuis]|uniref:Type III pantothenate kinase n=2 Tax=Rhodocyclus TaxID=1064 RepID=A0A6L5JXZ4_RHOTE|nr:type III pantothenate kinase [Rhodocyclus gracilis]MQY52205.1 type III pantothenate kinase [Rhodocyclus gracilis]MRD72365.1 type III pantothenate kinase [Rhodocyclus gracilis]NJA89549.1 type III pantothenate kinase [Rhodocyclus gracilis]